MTRLETAARLIGEAGSFEASPLGGGDLSEIWQLRFDDERSVVVKLGAHSPVEAGMLEALRQSGARTPQVLAVQADLLVLEYVTLRRLDAQGWRVLGRSLARLHQAPQPSRYGWDQDYAFGPMALRNGWTADWRLFWAEHRLRSCLDFLPRELAARVNHLAGTLDRFLPQTPRPALLHGDLWGGNILISSASSGQEEAVLIDPACVIGDASADFAMLTLFSAPPAGFWQSYGPLPEGYERAIGVYRLFPALVHYRLFGASYLGMVTALLDALEL